nr:structural protein [Tolivirales sp.]
MVKKRTDKKVEVDVIVKGNGNGGGGGKRRNRRRNRGRAQAGDMARSYGSGPNDRLRTVYSSVPAAAGFQVPRGFSMKQNGDVISISRCELWSEIQAGTTENFTAPATHPLIPARLDWLKGIAQNFSKWRWRSLSFKYAPTTSTTTSGGFGRGFGYDMAEATPAALATVAAFDQFRMAAFWAADTDNGIVADIGRFSRDWYPFIGLGPFSAIALALDRNVYSPGYISEYTSVSSVADDTTVGLLWACYTIELADPVSATLQPNA